MPRQRKVFPWTCMNCRRVTVKPKGSKERLCRCDAPKRPTQAQITEEPWKSKGWGA
jgi:hypothetical protein